MGFEVISRNHITPHRLYALLQLVNHCGQLSRRQVLDLLQPSVLNEERESQEISVYVYRTAINCSLIREFDDKERTIELQISSNSITTFEDFRRVMQRSLLGVVEESKDHFVLNYIAAWYSVQDEQVLDLSKADIEKRFHEQLYPNVSPRIFSEDPGVTAWMRWAEFLGWGWSMQFNKKSREPRLVPDATKRLIPQLENLIPDPDITLPFSAFMAKLCSLCPELDGGVLFNQAWEASRGNEQRGNRLSLMLSTALRVLHKQGAIELIQRADATDSWRLFPTQSYINQVTHIRRKVAA